MSLALNNWALVVNLDKLYVIKNVNCGFEEILQELSMGLTKRKGISKSLSS